MVPPPADCAEGRFHLGKTEKATTCHEKRLELDEDWTEAEEAVERLRQNKQGSTIPVS